MNPITNLDGILILEEPGNNNGRIVDTPVLIGNLLILALLHQFDRYLYKIELSKYFDR